MSVEVLGTDLLGEVNVEGLDEVRRDPNPSSFYKQRKRLTFPSFYIRYESSMPIEKLHLASYPSIGFSASFRTLPQLGSSNTTRRNGLLIRKDQVSHQEKSHWRS